MRKRLLVLASLFGLLVSPSSWAQATVYSFTGPIYSSFTNFTSPCATGPCANFSPGSRLTGQFTTAVPLASNLSDVVINPQVTSFSFTDGVNTYSSANPNVRPNTFRVSTDAGGNITLSGSDFILITLWQTGSSPHAVGDRGAWARILPSSVDAFNNYSCATVGTSVGGVSDSCLAATVDPSTSQALNDAVTGTWSRQSIGPIPTVSVWALVLLSLGLAGLAAIRWRKAS